MALPVRPTFNPPKHGPQRESVVKAILYRTGVDPMNDAPSLRNFQHWKEWNLDSYRWPVAPHWPTTFSPPKLQFLNDLLCLNPNKRKTANEALASPYLQHALDATR